MAIRNRTNCCDCGQLVDACHCSTAHATTECQYKSGSAAICGIPEFADPPEHWFRRRQTTGTMNIRKFADSACEGEVTVAGGLECRSKGATATLCGYSEYTSASIPPKKYLVRAQSGFILRCAYLDAALTTFYNASYITLDGQSRFDPDDGCTETDERTYQSFNSYDACLQGGFDGGGASSGFGCSFQNDYCEYTQTEKRLANAGSAYFSGGLYFHMQGVTAKEELSEEDTEDDALERALAGVDWSSGGPCSDNTSYRIARGAGEFSFTFRHAQTRVVVTSGLISGGNYHAEIRVGKRAAGSSDAFVDTGSPIIVAFTAAGSSYTGDWQDLPFESGWEYRALSVTVYGDIEQLIQDTWNIDEQFNSATCVQSVTNDSERTVDGEAATGPFDHVPGDAYAGHVGTSTTPTLRTTTGAGTCDPDGEGQYEKFDGVVQEELSVEDTVYDAASRAMAAISAWTGGACGLPAFITARTAGNTVFGFRWEQIRADLVGLGASGGSPKTYHITWRTFRRPNGSSLPYAFYSELIQEVTATADTMTSPWIDVPNEEGWDTMVSGTPTVTLVA